MTNSLKPPITPCIKEFIESDEYLTDENCYITELSNSNNDSELSIARARVLPGVTTHWHKLIDTAERYIIMEGTADVEIGDLPISQVKTGDVVLIPPMRPQRITNTGRHDLIFLAICTPRFNVDNYIDLEPVE